MARLSTEQWRSIRDSWEFDSDQPSLTVSASRAGEKFNFKSPAKSSVSLRMTNDANAGKPWKRHGSLEGINVRAHRKADAMVGSGGEDRSEVNDPDGELNAISHKKELAVEESTDLRAEVIARHRREWMTIIILQNEALVDRKVDHKLAFEKSKLAKINTEIIKLRQDGERRAWGLDDISVDVSKLSDAQLQDLIAGKMPR